MVEQQQQQPEKKGLFSGWFPKILLIIAVILIATVVLGGFQFTPADIFFTIIKIIVAIVLILLVVKGLQAIFSKPEFSPTRRWKEKLTRIAELSKPFNIKNLYIRGEDMRVYSKWGKITGLAFVPYISAKPKVNEKGEYVYKQKLDHAGNKVIDKKTNMPVMAHEYEIMPEKDGDWCFIVKRGFFIWAKKEIVRAHISLCSDIGEIVWIKCPNLLPVGDYLYPSQMWATDIIRIQQQHQVEALVETYQEFLDLVANITTMTLRADPHFRKTQEANVETIQTTSPANI